MMGQKHCTFPLLFRFNFKMAISQFQRVVSTIEESPLEEIWYQIYPMGERSIKSIQDNSVRRVHVVCD